jgi:hypothetical protein
MRRHECQARQGSLSDLARRVVLDREALVALNRTFVRKFFPNEDPLGKILLDGDKKISSEIVGVVSDYRPMGAENGNRPTIFHLTLQVPKAILLVRTRGPLALAAATRNAVWSRSGTLPAVDVLPISRCTLSASASGYASDCTVALREESKIPRIGVIDPVAHFSVRGHPASEEWSSSDTNS